MKDLYSSLIKKIGFGIKYGVLFGILGIPASLILSLPISIVLESIAGFFSYNVWHFSFTLSFIILLIPSLYYTYTIIVKSKNKDQALIFLFLTFIAFINACLFYKVYANNNDGQVAFALFIFPFKTAYIYPIIGAIHDLISIYQKSNSVD